jgi:uncharacterized integral membrane protein
MNIKLKATLITLAGFLGMIAFFYTIWEFPLVIVFAALAGWLYLAYRAVLKYLEHNERFKK